MAATRFADAKLATSAKCEEWRTHAQRPGQREHHFGDADNERWQTSWTSNGLLSPSVLCRNRTLRRLRMNTMAFDKLATKAVPAAKASSTVQPGCGARADAVQQGGESGAHCAVSDQLTDGQTNTRAVSIAATDQAEARRNTSARMYEGFRTHLYTLAISRVHASSSVIPSSVAKREADECCINELVHVITCSTTFQILRTADRATIAGAAVADARDTTLTCSAATRWVNMTWVSQGDRVQTHRRRSMERIGPRTGPAGLFPRECTTARCRWLPAACRWRLCRWTADGARLGPTCADCHLSRSGPACLSHACDTCVCNRDYSGGTCLQTNASYATTVQWH